MPALPRLLPYEKILQDSVKASLEFETFQDYVNVHNTGRLSIFEQIAPASSKRRSSKKKNLQKKVQNNRHNYKSIGDNNTFSIENAFLSIRIPSDSLYTVKQDGKRELKQINNYMPLCNSSLDA